MPYQRLKPSGRTQCDTTGRSRIATKVASSSTQSPSRRKSRQMRASRERAALTQQYGHVLDDTRMKIEHFVETKFIPEHVRHKSRGAQTQYHAVLKHILRPETVDRIFTSSTKSTNLLTSVPHWPYLDGVRLCDFNASHVRRILSFASSRRYSWQTVNYIKAVIGAIITHARQERCFNLPNPVSQVKLPSKFPMQARIPISSTSSFSGKGD